METFMASDIIKAVVARPFLEGVHSEDYAVPGDASRVTRWLSAAS